jgi:hypothetical protein
METGGQFQALTALTNRKNNSTIEYGAWTIWIENNSGVLARNGTAVTQLSSQ